MSSVQTNNVLVNGPEPLIEIFSHPSGGKEPQWGPEVELFLLDQETLEPIGAETHVSFVMAVKELLRDSEAFSDIDISAEPPAHMFEFKMNPMSLGQAREAFATLAAFQAELARIAKEHGAIIAPVGVLNHPDPQALIDNPSHPLPDDPHWGVRAVMLMDAYRIHMPREAQAYPVKHACVQMNTSHEGPQDMLEKTRLLYALQPFAVLFSETAMPFVFGQDGPNYNHLGLIGRRGIGEKGLISPLVFEAKDGHDYIRLLAERAYSHTPMLMHYSEDGEHFHIVPTAEEVVTFDKLPPALKTLKNLVNAANMWWHTVKHPLHPVKLGWFGQGLSQFFRRVARPGSVDCSGHASHNEGRDKDTGPSTIVDTFILNALTVLVPECRDAVQKILKEAGYDTDNPQQLREVLERDYKFLTDERHDFIVRGGRIRDIPLGNTTYGELGGRLYTALAPYVSTYLGAEYMHTFASKCAGNTNAQWAIDNCKTAEDALDVMRTFNSAAYGLPYSNYLDLENRGYLRAPARAVAPMLAHRPEGRAPL